MNIAAPPQQGIASEAVERPKPDDVCDICGKTLRQHNMGHGYPMCGFYAVFRPMRQVEAPDVGELVERLRDELHTVLWEAAKTAKPLRRHPVPKEEKGAFNYGKDCAACDIEQALSDMLERLTSQGGGC